MIEEHQSQKMYSYVYLYDILKKLQIGLHSAFLRGGVVWRVRAHDLQTAHWSRNTGRHT